MQRVLITGGAGFIGSHVTEALLARGDEVCVLDNFNDFYDPAIKRANAEAVKAAGARLVEGDIRDAEGMARLFTEGNFDAVIHLAAMAGVRPSLLDPLHYEDVNVRGTLILLEQIRKREGLKFVFASSSSVYGANEKAPFSEVDDIHRCISPYAATKRAGELHCFTYHHLYGIPISALRFFTVYGPRQRPEMAMHKFVRMTLQREPIPMFGDGSTRRDYTYIDDIVDGVVRSLDHCEGYEIYNLGESQTTSLAEMIEIVGEVCGIDPIIDRQAMQPGDVVITYADISKAKRRLGYDPHTTVRDGLSRFVEWYRQQLG
ncbi:GDP-mannose 4,6-dehydratase [Engelhardtia mirabilis]|uniref:UDP-glucose 4-epimerase n=1 Tax=Engelhardtia mirabilis TaxID=2528011 RepID=A0A518BKC0_9BACT|nr:UDP-glucose 4-epimerase [Planctomycetes bacterium Pla133]QDV01741.1 UDP-glucose 4-epimerase [Planctomycetes bacterium Pla86]